MYFGDVKKARGKALCSCLLSEGRWAAWQWTALCTGRCAETSIPEGTTVHCPRHAARGWGYIRPYPLYFSSYSAIWFIPPPLFVVITLSVTSATLSRVRNSRKANQWPRFSCSSWYSVAPPLPSDSAIFIPASCQQSTHEPPVVARRPDRPPPPPLSHLHLLPPPLRPPPPSCASLFLIVLHSLGLHACGGANDSVWVALKPVVVRASHGVRESGDSMYSLRRRRNT